MKKAREKFLDPDYRHTPETDEPICCRCEKLMRRKVGGQFRTCYLRADGVTAVHPADAMRGVDKRLDDLGWKPIGDDCARAIGLEWVHRMTW